MHRELRPVPSKELADIVTDAYAAASFQDLKGALYERIERQMRIRGVTAIVFTTETPLGYNIEITTQEGTFDMEIAR